MENEDPSAKKHTDSGVQTDDYLAMQAGTDECWWCKRRRTPAEIAACEAPDGVGRCGRW